MAHTFLVLVPLCAVKYIPRANRPIKSWDLKRCVQVRVSRQLCGAVAKFELDFLGRDLAKPLVSMAPRAG